MNQNLTFKVTFAFFLCLNSLIGQAALTDDYCIKYNIPDGQLDITSTGMNGGGDEVHEDGQVGWVPEHSGIIKPF